MTYQPKSYRKFLATSVAAAMVATVAAPLATTSVEAAEVQFTDVAGVSSWAGSAIDYLVGKGAIEGVGNGKFAPTAQLTRGAAAKILALSLDLEVDLSAKTTFGDAKDHWASPYIAAIQEQKSGVINGYNGNFNPNGNITRQEMAKMVVEAYGLELDTTAAVSFPDNTGWGKGYVEVLASLGVVEGVNGKFNPNGNVTRAESVVFVQRTEVPTVRKEVAKNVAVVQSVSAVNSKEIKLTGTALGNLKAEDVKVAGNTVSSYTAAADGKTATVVLGSLVTPDVEQTVTVNGKELKFTYKLVADAVQITEATYDDNRANQNVAFTVNGATANVADLLANGYTVQFRATNKAETVDVTGTVFSNTTNGTLQTDLVAGTEYKVQVTLTNGTTVLVSPVQIIKIANLDLAASAINSYEFTRGTVVQNSTKLVVGETASFANLKVLIDGTEEKGLAATKVESSNKAVASVNAGVVTAHTPGTTTLTIHYGTTKKDVTLTVVNEARKVNSVKVTSSATSDTQIYNTTVLGATGTKTLSISPLDQYGDPMNAQAVSVSAADTAIATVPATVTSDATGKVNVTITGVKAGNTTVMFKHPTNNTTLSTFGVAITENAGVATKKLEIVAPKDSDLVKKSADNTLDLSDDNIVEYKLNRYTSENHKIDSVDFVASTYSVSSSDTAIATAAFATDTLTITSVKKGTATITVRDNLNVVVGTITVTVVDNGTTITAVAFKPQTKLTYAKTVDYKQFLTFTEAAAGNDPIISGITLSKTTNNAIRLNGTTLYIDQDGNAQYSVGDKQLGVIELIATTDSTGLAPAAGTVNVVATNKGTLILSIKEVSSTSPAAPTAATAGTKIIATTSLEVDVK